MKNKVLALTVVHSYFIATILSIVCMFTFNREALFLCNTIAASSVYIAFGILQSEYELAPIIIYLSAFWALGMPLILTVVYIFALKKRYLPLCIFSSIDTAIVIIWIIYAFLCGNYYGGTFFVLDGLISIICTIVLYMIRQKHRQENKTERQTNLDKRPVLLSPDL